ncbi:DUF805 domain-containing protein [Microbacterium xanthum]|uniref:DUF805 domain-containing protein n=1 Tax=Microbacterium xanthum TaxID=3079794 RepID=UPI002AD51A16|nr:MULTISPECIES: DUF805 domain-containing protein [unclassified Microbacterium]MDZ8170698.1 DUF805 domain-containing protein [Microbacterium sp. KSW-48]MDZ8201224.1 DUF805 domain-containing protein [Microbacterium sp. SSW1-59]
MTNASASLSQPLYGATFGQAFTRFWKKYATFTGRASRSEFWWWYLAYLLISTVLSIVLTILAFAGATFDGPTTATTPGPLFGVGMAILGLWFLVIIVPTLAISWRRLHDTNRSGLWWFVGFIPVVGGIILLVLLVLDSDPAGARFDA